MNKHIAKTISMLSLFVMLSVSASNVFASGCATCRPPGQYTVSASAEEGTQAHARDSDGQETALTTQPEYSFLAFFVEQLAMRFL